MGNKISFDVNNQRTMNLIQRCHDGKTLIVIEGPNGDLEIAPDNESYISPGDFVLLIDYYRNCKRTGKSIL